MPFNELIFKNPYLLDDITNQDFLNYSEKLLKRDTGFEIEALIKDGLTTSYIQEIFSSRNPFLIHINFQGNEQRFRIPKGINGLKSLYLICKDLPLYCDKTNSGIHYHIDLTDVYFEIKQHSNRNQFLDSVKPYLLEELDKWEYKGTYNRRDIDYFKENRYYVRFKDLTQTIEFRIGEMSFDYQVLLKRILHCQEIVETFVNKFYQFKDNYKVFDYQKKLEDINKEIKQDNSINLDEINKLIKKRNE